MGELSLVRRKVARDGLRSLIVSIPGFLKRQLLIEVLWGVVPREELKAMTAANGRFWEFGTPERFEIARPPGRDLPQPFVRLAGTYENGRQFVCEVPNARLLGRPEPLCLTRDNRIITEAARTETGVHHRVKNLLATNGTGDALRELSRGAQSSARTATREFDTVFPLVRTEGSSSYYHWVLEDLPRVRAYHHYREETGNDPVVLLESDPPSWVLESLELAGVERTAWTTWDTDRAVADRLVVPMYLSKAYPYEPSVDECRWLRRRMTSALPDDAPQSGADRLYISREDADTRRVVNRGEVMDVLEPLGFEKYVPGELSVADQIRLFAGAETIVAPHGAGLTNMVFSDDPTIVEFLPERDPRAWFFALASQLGFEYEYLTCEHDEPNDDMRVDVDALRGLLGE